MTPPFILEIPRLGFRPGDPECGGSRHRTVHVTGYTTYRVSVTHDGNEGNYHDFLWKDGKIYGLAAEKQDPQFTGQTTPWGVGTLREITMWDHDPIRSTGVPGIAGHWGFTEHRIVNGKYAATDNEKQILYNFEVGMPYAPRIRYAGLGILNDGTRGWRSSHPPNWAWEISETYHSQAGWWNVTFPEIEWNAAYQPTAVDKNYTFPRIDWKIPARIFENVEMPAIDWYTVDWQNITMPAIEWNAETTTAENITMPGIEWNALADQTPVNVLMPEIEWYIPLLENVEMPEIEWNIERHAVTNITMPRIQWNAGRPIDTGNYLRLEYNLCEPWPEILYRKDAKWPGRKEQYWTCGIMWNIPVRDVVEMPAIEWNAPSTLEKIQRGYYDD